VAFIGKLGDDEFGQFVLRELDARGVHTSGVISDPGIKTGLSVALSRGNDRAILTYPGSIPALRYSEINQTLLARARHLHLGSYFLLDALRPDVSTLFDVAHSLGLRVSLDTNYDPTEKWNSGVAAALSRTDVFLPNETELCAIARQPSGEAALDTLASRVPTIAVKLGAQGAVGRQGDQIARAGAIPVTVVDTTGAGDSFDAGFVYGYLAGWELARALRFACVCGSLSTLAAGGTAAQPTLEEALEVM
jgi:sugar/nucleoside kinase (ribokinase family)